MAHLHTSEYPVDPFRNFDELPNTAFVRLPVLKQLFACSEATIWRRVADSRIPQPRKLSHRVTAWNVGQLRAALESILSEKVAR
jgi:predicted DNA-binding transcriptional regulator AlpA